MIPRYPDCVPISLAHRDELHRAFAAVDSGISECSFVNLYLFRATYGYQVTRIADGYYAVRGHEGATPFWFFPQGLPDRQLIAAICQQGQVVKGLTDSDRILLERSGLPAGFVLIADRNNFDYLYHRVDLVQLSGRKYHKKRNLINNFQQHYRHELRPLDAAEVPPARRILDLWYRQHQEESDYGPATEALAQMAALSLCGYIVYAEGHPAAFALGEGIARHRMYVIHFEKGLSEYKGIYQYINMAYAAVLPAHYEYINREQDMGDVGLRQAKMTYRPAGFTRKYRLLPQELAPSPTTADEPQQ